MTPQQLDDWLTEVMGADHSDNGAFFDLVFTLAEEIQFPVNAVWLGEPVSVLGIDTTYSSHSHGLKANLANNNDPVSFDELVFTDMNTHNARWLALYNYWREKER